MAKIDPEFIIMRAEPGENVAGFARRMVARAICENSIVLGEFNGHTLDARPGRAVVEVLNTWSEYQHRSYIGEQK